ncbi:MAG: hypothetical protein K1060chlam3_00213 [Candidatus Anoxychlamydiales bacterium]|nr:hypothetical protein [Candidatus Anoxychlamydiales bacterium]
MAVLGIKINFDSKSYEEFVNDANEISKVNPANILTWTLGKPKIYTKDEFNKKFKDSYIRSCVIHEKEEYSSASLKWAQSLIRKVRGIKEEDLALFDKVKKAFYQLSVNYDALFSERDLRGHEQEIFNTAFGTYKYVIEIMKRIIDLKQSEKKMKRESKFDLLNNDLENAYFPASKFRKKLINPNEMRKIPLATTSREKPED